MHSASRTPFPASVAETLNTRLSADTERRWKARQANGREAYGLYLQGRLEQRLLNPEQQPAGNGTVSPRHRRRIRSFRVAYVSLAEATLNSVTLNERDLAAVAAEAEPLLDQALALSPDMPEAIAARGWLALEQYRTDDALTLMQRALG